MHYVTILHCLLSRRYALSDTGFYMNSVPVYEQPSVNFSNMYALSATDTGGNIYTSTNLFDVAVSATDIILKDIRISQPDYDGDGKPDFFTLEADLFKPVGSKQITSISTLLMFQVSTSHISFPAVVQITFNGINIALANAAGILAL
jgi:hypothetical protein